MIQLKILKFLENLQAGKGLVIDMNAILKVTKDEVFNPTGTKKQLYVSNAAGGGDNTPLFKTGKFKRSLFVSGNSIRSSDSKYKSLKERYGSKYFKPTFSEIVKYIKIDLSQ
jgi:hypothetical protein